MEIVALDGSKLLALMVAGGTFALAGLWLMFRPQPAGEAARIELFGLKFQASSAGVLVFLIGSIFLAVPIFVPERERPAAEREDVVSTDPVPGPSGEGSGGFQPSSSDPGGADAANNLPSTTLETATSITLGTSVSGLLRYQETAAYLVAIPAGVRERITASLVATTGRMDLTLFDREGQVVGRQVADSDEFGTASVAGAIESQGYTAVVGNRYSTTSLYSLSIGVRSD